MLGGSLRLVINEGGVAVEPDFPACHVAGSCTLGIDQAENIHVVKELLRAGSTYTLWFAARAVLYFAPTGLFCFTLLGPRLLFLFAAPRQATFSCF